MKARKVKKLDPGGPLRDNALRIVRTRLDELHSFGPQILDPANVEELHDMRIAAKRLRYVLEMNVDALGPAAERGAKAAKKVQDLLGDIHDCDVFVPRVEEHIATLRAEDASTLRRAGGQSADLDPAVARTAPNRHLYRGLETLHAYLRARRELLYARFVREWKRHASGGLGPGLIDGLGGSTIDGSDEH